PRIWMSMSRDGLLPKIFSRIHPRYGTPSFSTIITGLVVAIPALFMSLDEVLALTSIGTLFAFVLVCGGILALQMRKEQLTSRIKAHYINGKFVFRAMATSGIIIIALNFPQHFIDVLHWHNFPMLLFWIVVILTAIFTFIKNFSLIPVLGLISCFYLMAQESHTNWMRFLIWLGIGLI